jgi:hypothetical protein
MSVAMPWSAVSKGTLVLLAVLGGAAQAAAQSCDVPASLWERPRSGAAVQTLQPVRDCMQGYLALAGSRLVIHHGKTDEVALQAAELRYWLIALAADGGRIELKDDLAANESIRIEVKEATK